MNLFNDKELTNLKTEDQLLLKLARNKLDNKTKIQLKNIIENKNIDWDYLFKQGQKNKCNTFLYYHLIKENNISNNIPTEIQEKWQEIQIKAEQRNNEYFAELKKIVKKLNENDIKNVILKGPVYAKTIYEPHWLRTFKDLDILVETKVLEEMDLILKNQGYKEKGFLKKNENKFYIEEQHDYYKNNYKEFHDLGPAYFKLVSNSTDYYKIEPHHTDSFIWPSGFKIKKMFNRSINFNIGNKINSNKFILEDEVIFAAWHAYAHSYGLPLTSIIFKDSCSLRTFTDVYLNYNLFIKEGGKEKELLKRAKEVKAVELLYYSLYYVNKFYPNSVSEDLLSELKNSLFEKEIYTLRPLHTKNKEELLNEVIEYENFKSIFIDRFMNPHEEKNKFLSNLRKWQEQFKPVSCNKFTFEPKMNGDINKPEWDNTSKMKVLNNSVPDWSIYDSHLRIWNKEAYSRLDCFNFSWSTGWDEKYLYLIVKVQENKPNFTKKIRKCLPAWDNIFLFISDLEGNPTEIKDYTIAGEKNGNISIYKGLRGEIPENINSGFSITNKGYIIEVAIPWRELEIKPHKGKVIGLNVGAAKWDISKGNRPFIVAELSWTDKAQYLSQYMSRFRSEAQGQIILLG